MPANKLPIRLPTSPQHIGTPIAFYIELIFNKLRYPVCFRLASNLTSNLSLLSRF